MKTPLKIILVLCVVAALAYAFAHRADAPVPPVTEQTPTPVIPVGEPVFAWSYKAVPGNEEIPRTMVSLTATYPDGNKITKEIETVQGESCNAYPEPDKDVYTKSEMIICYYAGLGHYYKVVEANGKYLVKRKMFEEASPDYNPPQAEFETLAEF